MKRRSIIGLIVGLVVSIITAIVAVAISSPAQANPPAAYTTNSDGSAVNANHYANKCDVYLNGGPVNADLGNGMFVFFVLAPSGQASPNGPDLLSTDATANRTFTSSGGNITYTGTHAKSVDAVTGGTLIDLCDPAYSSLGYNDTPNPGGVYILAICAADNQTPSGCKYDAFKVVGTTPPPGGTDLVATKTAAGSFTRTYTWDVSKSVDKTYVQTTGNTATFNYTVGVTKSAPVDSAFVVSGSVTVFNPNDQAVSSVAVSDTIPGGTCTVTGGDTSIAAGGSSVYNYSCAMTGVTATSTGTNTATVTWDAASINSPDATATATAPYDFSASPTVVGNCTDVNDTLAGFLGNTCASHTYTYALSVNVPTAGCATYNNTATVTGDSASAAVTVCRLNNNGYTMGYWQNKNGQALIKAYAKTVYTGDTQTLCDYLKQYSNVLTNFPSSCDGTSLAAYVNNVIKAANAAGTGAPMFEGQFLATALSAYFSPSLAATGIAVDPSIFGGSTCLTVSQLLAYGNTNYASLSANKTVFMAVKSVYDAINNDLAITC